MSSFSEEYNDYMLNMCFKDWCEEHGEYGRTLYNEWDIEKNKHLIKAITRINSGTVPFWKCKAGHEWQEPLIDRVQHRTTCKMCRIMEEAIEINRLYDEVKEKSEGKSSLLDWCIENNRIDLIEEWDFEKNLFEQSRIISKSGLCGNAFWICKNHAQSYQQDIRSRRLSHVNNCAKCRIEKATRTRLNKLGSLYNWCKNNGEYGKQIFDEYDKEKNIDISKIVYNYSKKVYWKCNEGHSWQTEPNNRTINKKGSCAVCRAKQIGRKNNETAITRNGTLYEWCKNNGKYGELILEEWDTEHNNEIGLRLDNVHAGSIEKAYFKCQNGHEFLVSIRGRTEHRTGCKKCSTMGTSYSEQFIYWALKQIYPDTQNRVIKFKSKEKRRGFEYDIYVPEENLYVEYSPTYWHWDKTEYDEMKKNICIANGGRYIEIVEDSFDELEHVINDNYICFKQYINDRDSILEEIVSHILKSLNHSIEEINLQEVKDNAWKYSHSHVEHSKSLENVYPELAKQWSYMLNGLKKPSEVTKASSTEVFWQCDKCGHGKNGEWKNSIRYRTLGTYRRCPSCGYNWQTKMYESTADIGKGGRGRKATNIEENNIKIHYPELAKEWCIVKNNIDIEKCSIKGSYKAWWKCTKCEHEWQAAVSGRTSGKTGCPNCGYNWFDGSIKRAGKKLIIGVNDLVSQYPELAKEWDAEKNDMQLKECMVKSGNKVFWKCTRCKHEWQATVSGRTSGKTGCPNCGYNWYSKTYIKRGRKKKED